MAENSLNLTKDKQTQKWKDEARENRKQNKLLDYCIDIRQESKNTI